MTLDSIRSDIHLYEQRTEILRLLMGGEDLDALIAVSGSGVDERRAVRFGTNYYSLHRSSAAVIWPEGTPTLIVTYPLYVERARNLAWTDDIRLAPDLGAGIAQALATAARRPKRAGVIGESLLAASIRARVQDLVGEAIDIESKFELACRVKTLQDQVLARRLGPLVAAGWRAILELVGEGATEREVIAAGQAAVTREGAEASAFLISSDGRLPDPWPRQRRLMLGDVVQLSLEVATQGGLWAQSTRTFCVKRPPAWAMSAWSEINDLLRWIDATLRPGLPVGMLADETRARLEVLGGKSAIPLGHGLGLNGGEGPAIAPDGEALLAPGMMVAIHPNVQLVQGGIFLGDSFLVTEGGAELLGVAPRDLVI